MSSADDKWQFVGQAFDLQIDNEVNYETVYSDWDSMIGHNFVNSSTITLTATMNNASMKVLTGGALELPEAEGQSAVEMLRRILSG